VQNWYRSAKDERLTPPFKTKPTRKQAFLGKVEQSIETAQPFRKVEQSIETAQRAGTT
jgi:hypothetical protein